MLRNLLAAFALLILSFGLFAQNQSWYRYDWNSKTKKDFPDYFNKTIEFVSNEYVNDIYVGGHLANYAYFLASGLDEDISLGRIYPPGALDFESYIRSILKVVIRDTFNLDKIKIHLNYNPIYNATMDGGGNLRINTGVFNYINNESELAAVLAHEFSHFLNKDHNKIYAGTKNFQPGSTSWFSQEQEAAADYLALRFLERSPYSTQGLTAILKSFQRFEIKDQILGKANVRFKTHPNSGERLQQMKLLSQDKGGVKRTFVVDSVKFNNIKKYLSEESINYMFESMDYYAITELLFTKYLFEPNNQDNLTMLLEAIRRLIMQKPKLADRQFILYPYKGKGVKKSKNYAYINETSSSILSYLNKGILHISTDDLKRIQANELVDSAKIEFTTYKEAFNYFLKRGQDLNCNACSAIEGLNIRPVKPEQIKNLEQNLDVKDSFFDMTTYKNESKDLYIVFYPNLPNSTIDMNSDKSYSVLLKECSEVFKSKLGSQCLLIDELPFKDQHLLRNSFYVVYDTLHKIKDNIFPEKLNIDWTIYYPELLQVYKKYNVSNINVVYFQYVDIYQRTGKDKPTSFCYFSHLALPDPKKKAIAAQRITFISSDPFKKHLENAADKFLFFSQKSK